MLCEMCMYVRLNVGVGVHTHNLYITRPYILCMLCTLLPHLHIKEGHRELLAIGAALVGPPIASRAVRMPAASSKGNRVSCTAGKGVLMQPDPAFHLKLTHAAART